MIRVRFRYPSPTAAGFTIQGHAGAAPAGEDIVCAAVSSAAYLAANTVTEVFGAPAEAEDRDGYMKFDVTGSKEAVGILRGLELHLTTLAAQYPASIQITTEV